MDSLWFCSKKSYICMSDNKKERLQMWLRNETHEASIVAGLWSESNELCVTLCPSNNCDEMVLLSQEDEEVQTSKRRTVLERIRDQEDDTSSLESLWHSVPCQGNHGAQESCDGIIKLTHVVCLSSYGLIERQYHLTSYPWNMTQILVTSRT